MYVREEPKIGTVFEAPAASCCSGLCSGLSSAAQTPGSSSPFAAQGCSKGMCGLCWGRYLLPPTRPGNWTHGFLSAKTCLRAPAPAGVHLDVLSMCLDTALKGRAGCPRLLAPTPPPILRVFPDLCPLWLHSCGLGSPGFPV